MGKKGGKKKGGDGKSDQASNVAPPAQEAPRPVEKGPGKKGKGGQASQESSTSQPVFADPPPGQRGPGKKGKGGETYHEVQPAVQPVSADPPPGQRGPGKKGKGGQASHEGSTSQPVSAGPPPRQSGPAVAETHPQSAPPSVWGRGTSQVPQQPQVMSQGRGQMPQISNRGRGGHPGGGQVRPQTAPGSANPSLQASNVKPQQQYPAPAAKEPSVSPPQTSSHGSPSSTKTSVSSSSSSQSLGKTTMSMKEMNLSNLQIPLRKEPNGGTFGKPILIETNHFSITIKNPNMKIYHYDVDIKPDKPFRLYRAVVEAFRRRNYPNNFFGFDGKKNIFTNIEMNGVMCDSLLIKDEEKSSDHRGIDYNISVSYANEFRFSQILDYIKTGSSLNPPQIMIQALDVVLRNPAQSNQRFIRAGRSFFKPPERPLSLGGGLNLWHGFYQSAIIAWRPFLNVDVAHKGFPERMNCVDALAKLTQADVRRPLEGFAQQNFLKFIKNLKISYEIPGNVNSRRTYKITGLADSALNKRFKDERDNNREYTVADYFTRIKNYKLKYPHLPCLQAGPKTPTRDVCLPMELCTVIDMQVSNKKLDENQTAAMVKYAARPTYERKENIMRSFREIGYNQDRSVQQFGVSVSNEFEKVNARVIPAPNLLYSGKKEFFVREGVWKPGYFISAAVLKNWAILNLDNRTTDDNLNNLYRQFHSLSRQVGVTVETPVIKNLSAGHRDISAPLKEIFKKYQEDRVDLVVVVIPPFGDTYAKVKQCAELFTGILTQCLKSKTVKDKLNPSTVTNIMLKVNAKLNGHNHSLSLTDRFNFLRRPVMIMGADVTYPSPDQEDIPAIAAITASFDMAAFMYNVEWELQSPKEEIISSLDKNTKSHLKNFYKKARCKPEKIIFYRDGVSEGQFEKVLNVEVSGIRRACTSLQADYKPAITFIVVQKRHHTRLFPIKDEDSVGRNRNVPPGTVVDQTITHPREKNFYLNSHASIQGTSRPAKYHVLWDDQDLSMDDLETMTYYLCHLFTRCTRTVSYPAPTYYAHLACARIKAYCDGRNLKYNDLRNEKLREVQNGVKLNNPMFFV